EAADGYESVEWAARLRGSNGKVGMYGFSYPGATQLLAAAARPPSLAAIAPGFTSSQFYDGWTYSSGALSLASMTGWATFLALHTGGWYDIFHTGTVSNFRRFGGKLLMGPWQHSPWRAITAAGRRDAGDNEVDDWHVRFFDEVLKGEATGVFDAAGRVYVLEE